MCVHRTDTHTHTHIAEVGAERLKGFYFLERKSQGCWGSKPAEAFYWHLVNRKLSELTEASLVFHSSSGFPFLQRWHWESPMANILYVCGSRKWLWNVKVCGGTCLESQHSEAEVGGSWDWSQVQLLSVVRSGLGYKMKLGFGWFYCLGVRHRDMDVRWSRSDLTLKPSTWVPHVTSRV